MNFFPFSGMPNKYPYTFLPEIEPAISFITYTTGYKKNGLTVFQNKTNGFVSQ